MKENKKIESIATLTEEEMVNIKGGATFKLAIVDIFPIGIPVIERYTTSMSYLNNQVVENIQVTEQLAR